MTLKQGDRVRHIKGRTGTVLRCDYDNLLYRVTTDYGHEEWWMYVLDLPSSQDPIARAVAAERAKVVTCLRDQSHTAGDAAEGASGSEELNRLILIEGSFRYTYRAIERVEHDK